MGACREDERYMCSSVDRTLSRNESVPIKSLKGFSIYTVVLTLIIYGKPKVTVLHLR